MNVDNQPVTLTPDVLERLFLAGQRIAAANDRASALQTVIAAISSSAEFPAVSSNQVDYIVIAGSGDGKSHDLPVLASWASRPDLLTAANSKDKKNKNKLILLQDDQLEQVRQGKALFLKPSTDPDSEAHTILNETGLNSVICISLMLQGKWLGVLCVGSDSATPMARRDVRVYQILAQHLALLLQVYGDQADQNRTTEQISVLSEAVTILQQERDLLEAILETSNDAIVMTDTHNHIITANLQFQTIFHVPRFQFVNRTVDDLVARLRELDHVPTGLMNLLMTYSNDTFQTVAGDFENQTKEKRVLVWYSAPVHGNDGTLFGRLFVFRDATREREVDRMKTEFVSLVSHELRTPLSSIKGFTDFILDGDAGPIDETVHEYLEIVKFNTDRLLALSNDILDITRIEAGRIELRRDEHPVEALMLTSTRIVRPMIDERGQQLEISLDENLPNIWVDKDRLSQVITNLVVNASKYTPKGGKITLRAHLVADQQDVPSSAPPELTTPAVIIGVHDTGMGIAEADQPLLFTRFYRTQQASDQQIAGTGLGLVIVKSLVELHGGQVWLESQLAQGSSFYFSVPLLEGIHELHTDR